MKTNVLFLAIISVIFMLNDNVCSGQDDEESPSTPHLNYDVQRIYDKEGNLVYYDSSVVYSDYRNCNSSEFDSLLSEWKKEDRNINYSIRFPNDSFSYSFQLPDNFFDFAPRYKFDMEVPELDSVFKGFDYYFSITPSDSVFRSDPYFQFHGRVPKIDPRLDSHMWEMEQRMREFHDRISREYEEWEREQREYREQENQPVPEQESISEPAGSVEI